MHATLRLAFSVVMLSVFIFVIVMLIMVLLNIVLVIIVMVRVDLLNAIIENVAIPFGCSTLRSALGLTRKHKTRL
jgi:hypothetical protein